MAKYRIVQKQGTSIKVGLHTYETKAQANERLLTMRKAGVKNLSIKIEDEIFKAN